MQELEKILEEIEINSFELFGNSKMIENEKVKEIIRKHIKNEEDILKFYYCESEDDYYLGQRVQNMYYAKYGPRGFTWFMSRYLPWGEEGYPSEPKEIPFMEWIEGFIRKHMNDGWIPVDERVHLPEAGEHVLVSLGTGFNPEKAFLSEDGRWTILHAPDGYNDITDMVEAWRPLPEPYRPERSERMSDDLISRKAVLDILTEERMRNSILASPAFTEILVQRVKDLPTAFNKEKVIAELNVKADYARDRWLNPTKEGYSKYWDGKENGFREALEIVERGGIE